MSAYIRQYRASDTLFDIVRFAAITPGTAAEVRARIEPWAEAGVTWWIVGTTGRPGAFQAMRQRIIQGPPQIHI